MLGKDFVLRAIQVCLQEGQTTEEISKWLGIDEEIVLYIEHAEETEEKWGKVITGQDIVEIYKGGLTFSEIAWIKGVTKEAIRLTVDSVIGIGKAEAKVISREKRKGLSKIIQYKEIVEKSEKIGKEKAMGASGYSESMFNQLYRELVKWKESAEEKEDENKVLKEGELK